MKIFEASVSDAEYLVDRLWIPLAREMEEMSDFNELSNEDVRDNAVDYFMDRLSDSEHTVFIAEVEGEAAGFVALELKMSREFFNRGLYLHIHELFVGDEFRRQGVASKLLERSEEFCLEEGGEMIQLSVNVRNDAARELYRQKGYDEERVKMVKEL